MLLRRLKARMCRSMRLAMQSHIDSGTVRMAAGLTHFMREVRGMGLQIFMTEMDVNDRALPAATCPSAMRLLRHATAAFWTWCCASRQCAPC